MPFADGVITKDSWQGRITTKHRRKTMLKVLHYCIPRNSTKSKMYAYIFEALYNKEMKRSYSVFKCNHMAENVMIINEEIM